MRGSRRGGYDGRTTSAWRIVATLLGVLAGVATLGYGTFLLIDRVTPQPVQTSPGVTTLPTATAEETRQTPLPLPTAGPEPTATPTATPEETGEPTVERADGVVVIDAGHQARPDLRPEPIGPGAPETKPSVTSGTRGVVAGKPESELNLEIALRLRTELQRRGVQVIMVRTTEDVRLTNRERAAVANRANADLFIRIHADGSTNRDIRGISTLVPGPNRWTRPIVDDSGRAGRDVHRALLAATGAPDLGVVRRSDLSGFNWSEVPSVLVEVGFMTNPVEDRMLATAAYQRKIARGIAEGTVRYLRRGR